MNRRLFLQRIGIFASTLIIGIGISNPNKKYAKWQPRGFDNSFYCRYRGDQFYETGYVYAPYMPLIIYS